jgi:hypothetical protein
MGYYLAAFVGQIELLRKLQLKYPHAVVVSLNQGIGMIPILDGFWEDLHFGQSDADREASEYQLLTTAEEAFGRLSSYQGPVAYFDISYMGGSGCQTTVVWNNGEKILGPIVDSTAPPPGHDGAVNKALRILGVVTSGKKDEFDIIGLGRHRETEDWVD